MTTPDTTALLQTSRIGASLASIDTKFSSNRTIEQHTERSHFYTAALTGLALFSGILYWNTTFAAEGMLPIEYLYFSAVCGCITNQAFNLESYISSSAQQTNDYKKLIAPLQQQPKSIGLLVSELVAGFITTVPIWYLGLASCTTDWCTIRNDSSALLNLPIYISSAMILSAWAREKSSASHGSNHIAALETLKQHFSNADEKERQQIREAIQTRDKEQTNGCSLSGLINAIKYGENITALPRLYDHSAIKFCLFNAAYSLLFITGMWQNFGFTVQAYNGGIQFLSRFQSIEKWLQGSTQAKAWTGGFFALTNLGCSIGYSISGLKSLYTSMLLGFHGKGSLEYNLEPTLYLGVCLLFTVPAVFSGTGSFAASVDGWNQVMNHSQNNTADQQNDPALWVSGWGANVGAALAYNLPQCLFLVDRILQTVIKRKEDPEKQKDLTFVNNLDTLVELVKTMKPEAIAEIEKQKKNIDGDAKALTTPTRN